jgi:outer membrane protein assembly factor BamB
MIKESVMEYSMRTILAMVLLAAFSVFAAENPSSGRQHEWPMIAGNPGWTSHSPDPRVKPPFRLRWATRCVINHSSLTVAGGRAYIGGYCLDADTGDMLWRSSWGKNAPTYYKGRLYGGGGTIVAVDAASGKRLWSKHGYMIPGKNKTGLVVCDGALYAGRLKEHQGKKSYFLSALDAENAEEIWSTPLVAAEGKPPKGYDLGVAMSAVAAGGGRVVVSTHSPKAVFALDRKTGKELWRQEGILALHAPGTDGKTVWVAGQVQGVWALDAQTGKRLWHWGGSDRNQHGAHYLTVGTGCHPPAVADGKLLFSNYGRQYTGLDADTGKQLWIVGGGIFRYGKGGCGPAVTAGGYIYSNCVVGEGYHGKGRRPHYYAFSASDANTGKLAWRYPLADKSTCSRVAIAYGRVYVPTRSELYCFEPVDAEDKMPEPQAPPAQPAAPLTPLAKPFGGKPGEAAAGGKAKGGEDWPMYGGCPARCGLQMEIKLPIKEAWKFQTGGKVKSSPVISGGMAYIGSDSGKLFALDLVSGKPKWTAEASNDSWIRCAPAVANGTVVCGADDGILRAYNAVSGKPKWEFRTAGRIRAAPAITGKRVVFGSWDGRCYCVRLSDGKEFWRYRAGEPGVRIYSPPVVAAGRVYVGAWEDLAIWALDLGTGKPLADFEKPRPLDARWQPAKATGMAVYRGILATTRVAYDPLMDAVTGKQIGRGTCSPSIRIFAGAPAFSGERIYTYRNHLGVKLSEAVSGGKPKRHRARFSQKIPETPLLTRELMIIATGSGTLEVLQLSDSDQSEKPAWTWKSPGGKRIETAPAAGSGFIILGSDDGHVYAFSYGT